MTTQNPSIPYIFGWQRCVFVMLAFYVGLLPFLHIPERCFDVIMPNILLQRQHVRIAPTVGVLYQMAYAKWLL